MRMGGRVLRKTGNGNATKDNRRQLNMSGIQCHQQGVELKTENFFVGFQGEEVFHDWGRSFH